jgi:BirA family biotin operon repressor/biotin-[acetyl-CoA-carboxylase] ligase
MRRPESVSHLAVLGTVGSTNDEAWELARQGAAAGAVVIAERQTRGRGRLGHPWFSPEGVGLYASVLLRPPGPAALSPRWTVVAALAACEACRQVGATAAEIKWPNDVLWKGKKLAGSLVEVRSSGDGMEELILGTGFNVNQTETEFPSDLLDRATSLRIAAGGDPVDRLALAAAYLDRVAEWSDFMARDAWPEVSRAWQALAPMAIGARIRLRGDGLPGRGVGTTCGLDFVGRLLVRGGDGRIHSIHDGDRIIVLEE